MKKSVLIIMLTSIYAVQATSCGAPMASGVTQDQARKSSAIYLAQGLLDGTISKEDADAIKTSKFSGDFMQAIAYQYYELVNEEVDQVPDYLKQHIPLIRE